jgi:hypothetical protein
MCKMDIKKTNMGGGGIKKNDGGNEFSYNIA